MKTFSIIVPYFNSSKYIKRNILSIVKSNYNQNKIEIIIIDDGSKNDLKKEIKNLLSKYKNIKLYRKKKGEWGSVINFVIKNRLAKKEYIGVLNSEDFYNENCFSIINQLPDSDILCGAYKKFNEKRNSILKFLPSLYQSKKIINDQNKMKIPFYVSLPFFVKKDVFYHIGKLIEKNPYQNGAFLSKIIHSSNSLSFTKKVIGYHFHNKKNKSSSRKWDHKKLHHVYASCLEYLKYDNQEFVFYKLLLNKEFRRILKKDKRKFIITRKFNFKYWPFYIRFFIKIILLNFSRNYFIFRK